MKPNKIEMIIIMVTIAIEIMAMMTRVWNRKVINENFIVIHHHHRHHHSCDDYDLIEY